MRLDTTHLRHEGGCPFPGICVPKKKEKKKKPLKTMTSASARFQLLLKSPHLAAALSSSGNWKHPSIPEFGPVTQLPK